MKSNRAIYAGLLFGGVVVIKIFATLLMSIIASLLTNEVSINVVVYATNIVFQVVCVLFCIMLTKYFNIQSEYSHRAVSVRTGIYGIITAVIGIICFVMITSLFGYFLASGGYTSSSSTDLAAYQWVLTIISSIIVAPICEEIIFRGGVLTGTNGLFNNFKCGKVLSVILCGFLFMTIHMNPEQTVYQFLFGCLLAMLVMSTKSIIPAIIAHMANNVVGIILMTDAGSGFYGLIDAFYSSYTVLFVIVAVLLAIAGFAVMILLSKWLGKESLTKCLYEKELDGVKESNKHMSVIVMVIGIGLAVSIYVVMLAAGMGG